MLPILLLTLYHPYTTINFRFSENYPQPSMAILYLLYFLSTQMYAWLVQQSEEA
jgi:hypothetical protein